MQFLFNIFKGMLIGVANVIPGVSGGTMAVSLGIYDRLIGSISGLLESFKKSISFLLPILIGCVLGIVCFTYVIEYLLAEHTFVTCMAFVGLILGGIPILLTALRKNMHTRHKRKIGICGIAAFLLAFFVCAVLPLLKVGEAGLTRIPVNAGSMAILFLLGVISSATMVIPGVSGSMMLMIFGYYYGIINTIKGFFDALRAMEPAGMVHGFLLLTPFGIGIILGIFLIAKLITFLFDRFGVETYCAILGLVLASPVAIFINTGLFSMLDTLDFWSVTFGIVLLAAGAMFTNLVGEK
ncbi:MAG: DUF368 domain-containing protein [Lachnospiraceae bacterium]|nr:DUF368 domain-containing protein [Lachnospiraceae bacterium]